MGILGNGILKGFTEKELVNGFVKYDKIQIKEVTSHFRNGWVFFVVYPKVVEGNILATHPRFVPVGKIKPLVVEKVSVKAKKIKGVENTEDVALSQEIGNRSEEIEQNLNDKLIPKQEMDSISLFKNNETSQE